MDYDVVVIGAGPGGCASAYYLACAGWRVLLAERRVYPVDKLCGEFWSPEGVESLKGLGLGPRLVDLPRIEEVLVSSVGGGTWQSRLPGAGCGGSRRLMDTLLAQRCMEVGVDVRYGLRVRQVAGDLAGGFRVDGDTGAGPWSAKARLVIGAYGKQGKVAQPGIAAQPRVPNGLMALKLHLTGQHLMGSLSGRVELHGFPGGYAGLCPVEDGSVNMCLLVQVEHFKAAGGSPQGLCAGPMRQNPLLAEYLDSLKPDWGTALAAANLRFGAFDRGSLLSVGDAATAISPLCGDGMSMALRMAEILWPLAHQFLNGTQTGAQLVATYRAYCRREFRVRLGMGRVLQSILLKPGWTRAILGILRAVPPLGVLAVYLTRGRK